MPTRNVGILIFDDVEVLDFAGPFEVFSMASAITSPGEERPFDVSLIAEETRPYRASGGIPGVGCQVIPHFTFHTCPHLQVVVVPGGAGTRVEDQNAALLDWLQAAAHSAEVAASVCTGAFLFAARGLLDGRRVTTHFRQLERLRVAYPAVEVIEGVRWVDEGHLISSAGVSAGIDMALQLVSRLVGRETARRTARAMQYEGTWETAART
jgi:transcriptional regulator GlxA family with amidase domain